MSSPGADPSVRTTSGRATARSCVMEHRRSKPHESEPEQGRGVRGGAAHDRAGRGQPRPRSRTSSSASRGSSKGNDELRMALTDPQLPAERRQAVIEELLEGKALPTTKAIVSFVVGIGRAGGPAGDRRPVRRRWRPRNVSTRSPRCAPRSRSTTTQRTPAGRGLEQGDRQAGRGEGRSSTRRCSAVSSPASATP